MRREIVSHVIDYVITAADERDRAMLTALLDDARADLLIGGACPSVARTLRMAWRELPWSTERGSSATLAVLLAQASNLCLDNLDSDNVTVVGEFVECARALRSHGVSDLRVALVCSVNASATVSDLEALLAAGRVVAAQRSR